MANNNYVAGRRFEYNRKKDWEKFGYTVLRTAGSHGFADLVAVKPGKVVVFIQCKVTKSQAVARNLIHKFNVKPPLAVSHNYIQVLEVKVAGQRGILSAEA